MNESNLKTFTGVSVSTHVAIVDKLEALEREHDIEIIYAAEDGRRASGTACGEAEFHIHYIYVKKPEAYVTAFEDNCRLPRAKVEHKGSVLNFTGTDVAGVINLHVKTNSESARMYHVLNSSIVYRKSERSDLMQAFFAKYVPLQPRHYTNFVLATSIVNGRYDWKKTPSNYLACVRAALISIWVTTKNTAPPCTLGELLATNPETARGTKLRAAITGLHEEMLDPENTPADPDNTAAVIEFLNRQLLKEPVIVNDREKTDNEEQTIFDPFLRSMVFFKP